MVGEPVSALLAAALLPVVAYCAFSLVRRPPDPADDPVPLDVVVWHGTMGLAMSAALLGAVEPGWDWWGAGLFVAAAVWCVLRTASVRAADHVARLFLMCAAMAAMLVPAGAASAATPGDPATGGAHPQGMPMSGSGGSPMLLSGGAAFVVAAAMALVALAAVRVVRRPAPVRARLSACCEVVMAGAMAVMAVGLV
jgi:hypothetical protein